MNDYRTGTSGRRRRDTVLNPSVNEGRTTAESRTDYDRDRIVQRGISEAAESRDDGKREIAAARRPSRGTVLNPAIAETPMRQEYSRPNSDNLASGNGFDRPGESAQRGQEQALKPAGSRRRGTVLNPAIAQEARPQHGGVSGAESHSAAAANEKTEPTKQNVQTDARSEEKRSGSRRRGTVLNPAVTGNAPREPAVNPAAPGTPRGTVLNPAVSGNAPRGTAMNPAAPGTPRGTVLNPAVSGNAPRGTAMNPAAPGNAPRGTVLNPAVSGNVPRGTVLNPAAAAGAPRGTALNPEIAGSGFRGTVVNPNIEGARNRRMDRSQIPPEDAMDPVRQGDIPAGTLLLGGYRVESQMNVDSGEADLYHVTFGQTEYVAKVYRRKSSIKPEVVEKLLAIRSPYVAKIFDIGEYGDHTVEIIPFYRNGTLQGKKFSFRDLKEWIIPSLNQGLHDLHEIGIIHKDLKPSNIMLNDDERSVSIIDFGISSVKHEGESFLVTETGRTPIYSAPETSGNLFLSESDYYSLGITVFELYSGMLPYDGLSDEQRMRIISLQKIPCPPEMPDELKQLIWGLTYSDLTNRNDKKNPNRRWTYEEVVKWCRDEKQVTPGDSFSAKAQEHPYSFRGKSYTDLINLLLDFNKYWEEGKKQLFRGNLRMYFLESNIDQTKATYCEEAEEELTRGGDADLIFFRTLYYLCPEMRNLLWKGHAFADLVDLGKELLGKLRHKDFSMDPLLNEMAEFSILSRYQRIQDQITRREEKQDGTAESEQFKALEAMEAARRLHRKEPRFLQVLDYQLGFMLSGSRTLVIGINTFTSVDELTEYVRKTLEDGEAFDRLYEELMEENGELTPQFESWLLTQNKRTQIEQWRRPTKI